MRYAVDINGDILIWEDGKFLSDSDELIEEIRKAIDEFEKNPNGKIMLDGSVLAGQGGFNPEKNWHTSYGFLQDITGNYMKFVAGDRPTWEKLGYKLKDGEIP